jgi:uncharacterized membrane protein YfcA
VSPLEAVGLAVWCFAVALAGGAVGLVLGNIRLPVVIALSSSPAAGGGANIAVSGIAAAAASWTHLRAARVNWRLFAWMTPPSVAGAVAGGYLAGVVSETALLLVIAAVLFWSGVQLLIRPNPVRASGDGKDLELGVAAVSGFVIGLLGGFVGLILGSLRMPALLRLVGEVPHRAVGTNLLVGVCVGAAGLVGHLPSSPPDPAVLAVAAGASIPGALLGARLTGRLSEPQLVRAIGAVLLVAGAAAATQAFT